MLDVTTDDNVGKELKEDKEYDEDCTSPTVCDTDEDRLKWKTDEEGSNDVIVADTEDKENIPVVTPGEGGREGTSDKNGDEEINDCFNSLDNERSSDCVISEMVME